MRNKRPLLAKDIDPRPHSHVHPITISGCNGIVITVALLDVAHVVAPGEDLSHRLGGVFTQVLVGQIIKAEHCFYFMPIFGQFYTIPFRAKNASMCIKLSCSPKSWQPIIKGRKRRCIKMYHFGYRPAIM